ncbi:two-component sensor histidine kinase [Flavobacterium sp. 270]|uniref:tetratricopeptide repeat-containing sensor histidine kinase n=1 Tax=Flavobacterium sp. 270 TaxID=2512114 RepID=UPI0010650D80|nr:histidine kinase dimerization/phosphoacceptor domain -containing protein [Flavobacterium sp. 270]TDW47782.1 two-component sensor histidine kinase [Flavobacterium sp. 270]
MKLKIFFAAILLITIKSYTQNLTEKDFKKAEKSLLLETDKTKKALLLNRLAHYYIVRNESVQDIEISSRLNSQSFEIGKQLGSKDIIAASMHIDGQIAKRRKNKELAAILKNKALVYSKQNGLKNREAEIYKDMAFDFPSEDLINREKYIRKAISLFKEQHNLPAEGDTYYCLARFYEETPDSILKYTQKAIEIKKRLKNAEFYKEYTLVVRAYLARGKIKEALAYALQADLNAEDSDASPIWRSSIYNQLAITYEKLNIQEKALFFYRKAVTISRKSKNSTNLEAIQFNLAKYLYFHKQFDEALAVMKDIKFYDGKDCKIRYQATYMLLYCKLKQYKTAKIYFKQLLQCDIMDLREKQAANTAIAQYLLMTGQATKSYPYIQKLKEQAITEKNDKNLLEAERAFFSADSAVGNCAGALEHFKKYKSLNDSIFNNVNSQQYNDLQLKYETEKKDKNIIVLKQQSEIQKQVIRKAEILRYLLIAGFGMMVLFITLLYNRSRLKQRAQNKINEQNDQLKILLSEKEWLIKEIHHRVKNNLQIVISLLNTQSEYLDNEYALAAIQNSQNRMYAMSLIHQKLYQSDDLAMIDMAWYIKELVSYLKECFSTDQKINYKLDTECVELDVTQAVPLGLILNEAVSNAIKYAFNHTDNGQITIELGKQNNENYRLVIKDNGVGLSEEFELKGQDSFGMNLMKGLANQINGTLEIQNIDGLTIMITFRKRGGLI